MAERVALSKGRVACPKCGAKGVGYLTHPYIPKTKDYSRARCRYCRATFTLKAEALEDLMPGWGDVRI